jgi:ATP-binding cassette, subfamily B, bacterial
MLKNTSINQETFKIFWKALAAEPKLFALVCLNLVGILFMSTITPLLVGRMIASMAQPGSDPYGYLPVIILSVIIGLVSNRIGFRAYLVSDARAMSRLQFQIYNVLLRRSVGFHNNNVSGKLVSDAMAYPTAFQQLYELIAMTFLPFLLIIVGGLLIVSFASWQLGLIVLAMAIFTFGTSYVSEMKRRPIRRRRVETGKKLTAHFADSIVNMQAVATFAAENRELNTHKKLNERLRDMRERDWKSGSNTGNNRIFVLYIMQISMICILVNQVRLHPELLGIGIFTFIFTTTITNRLFDVDRFFRLSEEAFLLAQPMTETILEEHEIQDIRNAKEINIQSGAVAFRNVTFAYNDSRHCQTVFKELSFSVYPGEKIGLVGPSGGGKSTLTRLLLRFEDIQSGSIEIDDQNIAHITQTSLRQNISYVPQEPLLFHRSIRENIAYGRVDATEKDIRHAAKLAYAQDFIEMLPDGFETIVGERGVKLSGGQRQRIAIARAILKDAPILILDEATSALDSESETHIQSALNSLMKDRTTLVIAHRLSTIQRMDRIIVLDDGKIIEQGSHAELITKHGLYAKLWAHQSGGFIDE